MKAITLYQPWASAMALKLKLNETRGRRTSHRGDIVITAGRRRLAMNEFSDEFYLWLKDNLERFATATFAPVSVEELIDGLPYGRALCMVDLFEVLPWEQFKDEPLDPVEEALGGYGPGRIIYKTRNIRPFPNPVPIIGHQYIFEVDMVTAAEIDAQL